MSAINPIMSHDLARWIIENVAVLEGRAKFCAHNSIRFLNWADDIFEKSHIVSSFCALHATEEAVAAFVSAAKFGDYKAYAKSLNLRDHLTKALVSIFAQRLSIVASEGNLAIAVHPKGKCLVYRVPELEGYRNGELHLSSIHVHSSSGEDTSHKSLLGEMPNFEKIEAEVKKNAEARNEILYASKSALPSGFIDPEAAVIRETQMSLALIWAAIDLKTNPNQSSNFVKSVLEVILSLEANRKKKEVCPKPSSGHSD